jgi:hypothetical protein
VPQDECNSDSDVVMAKNWQHLCQKLNVQAELDVFIRVKNNVALLLQSQKTTICCKS